MTEEQVARWQARRDEAKRIEDPVAREKALDMVYDLKDDMQLDCQRKLADRIKDLVSSDREKRIGIDEIKTSVNAVRQELDRYKRDFDADHATVEEFRENRLRAHGFVLAVKWLGYLLAAGGGSVVTWVLTAAGGAE